MNCTTPQSSLFSESSTTALKTYRNKRKYPSENEWDTLTKRPPPSNVTAPSPRTPLAATPQQSSSSVPAKTTERRFFTSRGISQNGIGSSDFYGANIKNQTLNESIAKRPRPSRLSEPPTARRGLLADLVSHPGVTKEAKPVDDEVTIIKPPPNIKPEEIGFPNLGEKYETSIR